MKTDQYFFRFVQDWRYLRSAHEHALSNREIYDTPDDINAAYCRLLSVHMVSCIEAMLQRHPALIGEVRTQTYFQRKVNNNDRIDLLIEGFTTVWSPVDHDIVTDFIAIKVIRDSIVHTRELERYSELLKSRGFPTGLNNLNESHWNRMCQVYREMLRYIHGRSQGSELR